MLHFQFFQTLCARYLLYRIGLFFSYSSLRFFTYHALLDHALIIRGKDSQVLPAHHFRAILFARFSHKPAEEASCIH